MPAGPEAVRGFTLAGAGAAFVDDPYPTYAALRQHDPVHALGPGSWLLTRYDDVLAVYREPAASSDKRREFAPKFGADSPLYEHHTTSLVFNDPPLHTRVRRLLVGALNQQRHRAHGSRRGRAGRRPARPHAAALAEPDLIEDFAARIPVEVIGNLLDVPARRTRPAARLVAGHPVGARARARRRRCWRAATPRSRTSWPT